MKIFKLITIIITTLFTIWIVSFWLFYGYFPPRTSKKVASQIIGRKISENDKEILYNEVWYLNGEGGVQFKYKIESFENWLPLDKEYKKLPIVEDLETIEVFKNDFEKYKCDNFEKQKNILVGYYSYYKDTTNGHSFGITIIDITNGYVFHYFDFMH